MLVVAARPPAVLTSTLAFTRRLSEAPHADQTVPTDAVEKVNGPLLGPLKVLVATGPLPPAKKISEDSRALAPAGKLLRPLYVTPTMATVIPAGTVNGMDTPQAFRSKLRAPPALAGKLVNRSDSVFAPAAAEAVPAGHPVPPTPSLPMPGPAACAGTTGNASIAIAT